MQRHGLFLPGIRFRGPGESQLAGMAFRLEVLEQDETHEDTGPNLAPRDRPIDALMDAAGQRVDVWKVHWLQAEDVASSLRLQDTAVRAWLTARYSLTDLKLLLRAVLAPPPASPPYATGPRNASRPPSRLSTP
jgi:hypothetical protein